MPGPRRFRVMGHQIGDDQMRKILAYEYDESIFSPGEIGTPNICSTRVGTLTKSTGGAGAQQSVTGIPFLPRAVIFFSTGGITPGTWRDSHYTMIGFATATEQMAAAVASEDNNTIANASRIVTNNHAITFVQWGETVIASATCVLNADGFTLTWDVNDGNAFQIGYMVIGGTDADLVNFQAPGVNGAQTITGVPFPPQVVIFAQCGAGATAINTPSANAYLGIGMADTQIAQWAMMSSAADGVGTMQTHRTCDGTEVIFMVRGDGSSDGQARVTSMNPDGFTLSWGGHSLAGGQIIALCLRGCNFRVGSRNLSTTEHPDDAAIPFTAGGAFVASLSSSPLSELDAALSLGATDGTTHATARHQDDHAAAVSNVAAIHRTDATLLLGDDFAGSPPTLSNVVTVTLPANTVRFTSNPGPPTGLDFVGWLAHG